MNRPVELLGRPVTAIRERYAAAAGQSERTILLGTILLASAVSGATGLVLAAVLLDRCTFVVAVPVWRLLARLGHEHRSALFQ